MAILNQERINELSTNQALNFENALYLLRAGKKVCRANWKNVKYIEMQKPDEFSKMKQAYIFAVPLDNQPCPWTPSATDLFAEDWSMYNG